LRIGDVDLHADGRVALLLELACCLLDTLGVPVEQADRITIPGELARYA
jgi:hypothetical protein